MTTDTAPRYVNMDDLRDANARHGHHWFEPATMRFFASRVGALAYATPDGARAYFVSSEQFRPSSGRPDPRRYTVRVCDMATGNIDTVGEFQAYASRSGADAAARRMAERGLPA